MSFQAHSRVFSFFLVEREIGINENQSAPTQKKIKEFRHKIKSKKNKELISLINESSLPEKPRISENSQSVFCSISYVPWGKETRTI